MKNRSYESFLTREDRLQIAVINYIKLAYPLIVPVHVPNEGKRTLYEQWKLKQMGLTAGVPDILIFFQRPKSEGSNVILSGLAIELKVKYDNGKKNVPTPKQKRFLQLLHDNGWYTAVIYTIEDAKKVIDKYLKLKDL